MDFLNEIWQTLTKNPSRTILTAFGVFWGMLMLMILLGLGNGLTNGIYSNIEGFDMNTCIIGANQTSKPYKGFQRGRQWEMLNSDMPILQAKVKSLKALAPMCYAGNPTMSYLDKHESYAMRGVVPQIEQVMRVDLLMGRFINEVDISEKRKVCVIGIQVYQVLFPQGENPIGKNIKCGNVLYTVVGVKQKNESNVYIGSDPDKTVQIPLSTCQQVYNYGNTIHQLMAVGQQGSDMKQLENDIKTILADLHNIAPDDKKAFWGFNTEEEVTALNYLTIGLNALIWLIGLGTLISGAVGVSNIMLVTVRERTKEIGIRRAIGASPWLIVRQIMAESTLLTAFSGVFGIVAGVGILRMIEPIIGTANNFIKSPQVSLGAALACLFIIILIGIFSGLLPAIRALKIKPIEALGEE